MDEVIAERVSLSPNLIFCNTHQVVVIRVSLFLTYANRHGIVFVDDGNNSHGQQLLERVHSIEISRAL